ncbi:MAG: hypothetical protein NVS3B6_11370 [Pseudarthrobacter sp.]
MICNGGETGAGVGAAATAPGVGPGGLACTAGSGGVVGTVASDDPQPISKTDRDKAATKDRMTAALLQLRAGPGVRRCLPLTTPRRKPLLLDAAAPAGHQLDAHYYC